MTKLEQDALICLYYEIYSPLAKMSLCVVSELALAAECNPEIVPETADTYRAVLVEMIAKNWVKVVREPRAERMARLRAAGWIGPWEDWAPEQGDLAFTRKGYALFQRTLRAAGHKLEDTLVMLVEDTHTVILAASTKAECLRQMSELFGNETLAVADSIASMVGRPVHIVAIEEPVRVGRWMDREAYPHKAGWRITIHYRPIRRRRVDLPELWISGWLSTMLRTTIDGKVRKPGTPRAFEFHLSNSVAQAWDGHVFYIPSLIVYDGQIYPKPIYTILDGEKVTAGEIGDGHSHFEWRGTDELTGPMTSEQAIGYLRQGIAVWQVRGECPSAR